jgi:hypothetical protein
MSPENKPIFISGFMIGPDCLPLLPSTCSACASTESLNQVQDDGLFVLRTYYGGVLRKKLCAICSCGAKYKWEPSSEYIHCIKDDTEGGE